MKSEQFSVPFSQLLLSQSIYYWSLGFNVTHIDGSRASNPAIGFKNPTHDTSNLKYAKQNIHDLQLFDWLNATGLGAICGVNGIRCIDIDYCASDKIIIIILSILNLPPNYEWVVKSGSGKGYHIWVKIKHLPSALEVEREVFPFHSKDECRQLFGRLELRWSGHTMLPPSKHNCGDNYQFLNLDSPRLPPVEINSELLWKVITKICMEPVLNGEVLLQRRNGKNYSVNYPIFESLEVAPSRGYSMVVIDVETTGLPIQESASYTDNEAWPYIVEVAWIHSSFYENGGYAENRYTLNPEGYSIPDESVTFHGITDDYARETGVDRGIILSHLARVIKETHYVIFHNASFDVKILNAEFYRNGIDCFIEVENRLQDRFGLVVCTMEAGANYLDSIDMFNKGKWPSLLKLYQSLFSSSPQGAHSALGDARATLKCFDQLLTLGIISHRKNCSCFDDDCCCTRGYLYYDGLIPFRNEEIDANIKLNRYIKGLTPDEFDSQFEILI